MIPNDKLKQACDIIESLTQDEDLRGELWLLFLSGCDPENLYAELQMVMWERQITDQISTVAFHIATSNSAFTQALDFLSPIERSVLVLVAAGVAIDTIAWYKSISPLRVKQILFSIQRSPIWNSLYRGQNVKEET